MKITVPVIKLDMDNLAKKIRHARRDADLSQKKLGKKLGVSEMAISAYETGRAIPPWPALKKISQATGFPLEYFTEEQKKNNSMADIKKEVEQIKKDVKKILKFINYYENR